jgi:SAM-dependent methyltransferase
VHEDPFGLGPTERLEQYRRIHFPTGRDLAGDPVATAFGASVFDTPFYDAIRGEIAQLGVKELDFAVDIGCATGRSTVDLVSCLSGEGIVLGVDSNIALLKWAATLVRSSADLTNSVDRAISSDLLARFGSDLGKVMFAGMDALNLAVASDAVDIVLALNVIDRFDKPELALAEIARVTKPGGHFVVACPFDWPRDRELEFRPLQLSDIVVPEQFELVSNQGAVPWSVPDARSNRLVHLYACEVAVYRRR